MRNCHPGIFCEQLEERIVLDATIAPTDQDDAGDQSQKDLNGLGQAGVGSHDPSGLQPSPPNSLEDIFKDDFNLALISNALDDIEGLKEAAGENSKVMVFDAGTEDLQSLAVKVSDMASSYGAGIDNLLILDHGAAGTLSFGTSEVGFLNVSEFAADFELMGSAMDQGGLIHLYGCSVAGDFFGTRLVDQIADYSGAQVFASSDQTGGNGGDWELEYSSEPDAPYNSILDQAILSSVDSQLAEAYPAYENNWATALNKVLYYVHDDGTHGKELWRSDGTADGTYMVKDINPGVLGSDPTQIMILNGKLVFAASDGKSAGSHGRELWISDGAAGGTHLLKDINDLAQQDSDPRELMVVNGTLFFTADDLKGAGRELWKSDGTAAGTVLVADINTSGDGNPQELTDVDGTLFFRADGGLGIGVELWKSDGSEAGTILVKDINPGAKDGDPTEFTAMGQDLYFRADGGKGFGVELWKSDGTDTGTVMVMDINPKGDSNPTNMTAINGTLYFSASDGIRGGQDHGTEVWVTDGASTYMLEDINQGKGDSDPADFTLVNGEIYFSATDGTKAGAHGRELWKVEATGASLVMDINPGARDSSPRELKDYDGVLLFAADDGIHGYEPWRSDGSAGGTFMIEDINPVGSSFPINHARVNPLFFLADDGNGYELWRSDGTAQGTVKVSDVESAGQGASSQGPVIANNPNDENNSQNLEPNTNDQVPESSDSLDATISTISVAAAKTSFVPSQGSGKSRSSYEVSSGGAVESSDLPLYEKVSRDYENRHKEGGDQSSADLLIPELTKVVILTAGHYSISSNSITMTITPNVWLPDIVEWYLIAMSEGRYKSGTLPPEHERMIWDFLSYVQTRKEDGKPEIGEMELRLAWQWAEWRKQLSATDGTADPLPWSYFEGLSQALTLFYGRNESPVDYAQAIHALQHNAGRLSIIPLTLPDGTDVPNISDISKYISNSGMGEKSK